MRQQAANPPNRTQQKPKRRRMMLSPHHLIAIVSAGFLISAFTHSIDWYRRGSAAMLEHLNTEYQQQIGDIKTRNTHDAALLVVINQTIIRQLSSFRAWIEERTQKLLSKSIVRENQTVSHLTQSLTKPLAVLGLMLLSTLAIITAKLMNVFFSFWLFLFAMLLGVIDGLVQRYIRTMEGGRESTFVFHQVADSLIVVPVIILLLYLCVPVILSPAVVITLLTISLFSYCHLIASRMKKYV